MNAEVSINGTHVGTLVNAEITIEENYDSDIAASQTCEISATECTFLWSHDPERTLKAYDPELYTAFKNYCFKDFSNTTFGFKQLNKKENKMKPYHIIITAPITTTDENGNTTVKEEVIYESDNAIMASSETAAKQQGFFDAVVGESIYEGLDSNQELSDAAEWTVLARPFV
jgi:hypothetical protein